MIRADAPLRIRSVIVEGNNRTDASVIEDELQEAYRATTIQGVHVGLLRASRNFERLGIFNSVSLTLTETPKKNRHQADLLVHVDEKSMFSAYAGTSVSRDDVGLDASGTLRNPFGRGEMFEGSVSRSKLGSQTARINYNKPRVKGAAVSLNMHLRDESVNMEATSSLQEKVQAFGCSLTSHNLRHRLSYEFALRDILPRRHLSIPYAYDASLSVIKEAQPNLKSSIKYQYQDDQRNDPIMPTSGTNFSTSVEVAGLALGDVAFVKGEVAGASHVELGGGVSMGLLGSLGIIRPTGWRRVEDGTFRAQPTTTLHDRFFLGGLPSVRGFGPSGLGPRAPPMEGGCVKGDSLGGDFKYSATLSLSAPLPILPVLRLRAHAFTDVANLLRWSAPLPAMATQARVSMGMGLAASIGVGRLELNYSVPVRTCASDIQQRWQFGLAGTIN